MEAKCPKCEYSIEVEDATKRYKLPLFFVFLGTAILAYGNIVSNPSMIITILGSQSATVGLIWLVVTRVLANRG